MNYLELSRLAILAASILITIGLYDQSLKIWRTKSAKDLTLTLVFALVINEATWLNYGFALREWPIIAIGLLNTPAVLIATVGYLRYR
jgi:MtN3 and saliva related transmembrane protein